MKRFHERRRNYYIKKKFQRNFILKFCALVLMGSVVSGAIIYAMSKATVTTTFENSRLVIKSTADFLLPAVLLSSAAVILSTGLAAIVITLFTSHKIAGPLYRMEQDVMEVARGNLKVRFNLRQDDELKQLAASLGEMTQALNSRVSEAKKALDDLESSVSASSGEVGRKLSRLRESLDKFIT